MSRTKREPRYSQLGKDESDYSQLPEYAEDESQEPGLEDDYCQLTDVERRNRAARERMKEA